MSVRVIFLEKNPDEESINYYFSKDPMNPDNMPAPISVSGPSEMLSSEPDYGSEAVGWTVDWDRDEDAYVRVGVVKNGVESISKEWIYNAADFAVVLSFKERVSTLPEKGGKVSFSPSGDLVAICYDLDGGLIVAKMPDLSIIEVVPDISGVCVDVCFSRDSKYLAVSHTDSPYLTVIDTSSWSVVNEAPSLSGQGSVDFSMSSDFLVCAGDEGVVVVGTSNWEIVPNTPEFSDGCRDACFSYDGSYLAVSHRGPGQIEVISSDDWSVLEDTPEFNSPSVTCLKFTPSGDYLIAGGPTNTIGARTGFRVFDTSGWDRVTSAENLNSRIRQIDFNPEGTLMSLAGSTGPMDIVDTSDWSLLHKTPNYLLGMGGAFSPCGKYVLYTADRIPRIELLRIPEFELKGITPHIGSNFVTDIAISKEAGQVWVSSSGLSTNVSLSAYRYDDFSLIDRSKYEPSSNATRCVSVSPDGNYVALGLNGIVCIKSSSFNSVVDGRLLSVGYRINDIKFTGDSRYLVSACQTLGISIVDTEDWTTQEELLNQSVEGLSIDFNDNFSIVALGVDREPYLYFLSTEDWSIISASLNLQSPVKSVCFISGKNQFAICCEDSNIVYFISADTLNVVSSISLFSGNVYKLSVSNNSAYLGVAHNNSAYSIVGLEDMSVIEGTPNIQVDGRAIAFDPEMKYIALGHRRREHNNSIFSIINIAEE